MSRTSNRRLFLYAVNSTSLTSSGNGKWKQEMLLFCVDEIKQTHVIRISKYKTSILLQPKQKDIARYGAKAAECLKCPGDTEKKIAYKRTYLATKLIGFSNSKPVRVLKLHLHNESDRYSVLKALRENDNKIGGVRIKQVLHTSTAPETQFLYDTGLRLQSWFDVSSWDMPDVENLFDSNLIVHGANVQSIRVIPKESQPSKPELTRLYIRQFGLSSTATRTNQYDPSYDILSDEERCISFQTSLETEPTVLDISQFDGSEAKLLEAFGQHVLKANVQVFVYASDERCSPNGLVYLQKRAQRYGVNLHICKLPQLEVVCRMRSCQDSDNEFLEFEHPGSCRMDMCQVLKKAMVSPNLDGFRLLDALRHPKLISKTAKPAFKRLLHLNYHGVHNFSSLTDIREDLAINTRLLRTLEIDNRFLTSQQNISNICETDITSVAERGQQVRVRNLFGRSYHDESIIVNNLQCAADKPFIVLRMNECNSSYPAPQTLSNPPVSAMRGTHPPQHTIVQKLPSCLEFLRSPDFKDKHNNLFNIPDPPPPPTYIAPLAATYPGPPPSSLPNDTPMMPCSLLERLPTYDECKSDTNAISLALARTHLEVVQGAEMDEITRNMALLFDEEQRQKRKAARGGRCDDDDDEEDEEDNKKHNNNDEKCEPPPPPYVEFPFKRAPPGKRGWWSNLHNDDFVRKSRKRIKTQAEKDGAKRFRGGLVLDPEKGFYTKDEESAATFDFGSLYPSIIQSNLLCFQRVLYKQKWLKDPLLEIEYVPITSTECLALAKSYNGVPVRTITPKIVQGICKMRKDIRTEQKTVPEGTQEWDALESAQLAAKVVQNSVYGFIGSATSGMTVTALAAAVTQIGQWMNKCVRFLILFLGGFVYYGDTDSCMARFWVADSCVTHDQIMTSIYAQADRIQKIGTKLFPAPNVLEWECVKRPFLLCGKKTYAAYQWSSKPEGWKLPRELKANIKGMAAKKRDKCSYAQTIGSTLIVRLLDNPNASVESHAHWFEQELEKIPKGPVKSIEELNPFVITCALNDTYKKTTGVLALSLADMMTKDTGARPRPGTRLAYVSAYKPKERLHCNKCFIPDVFLQEELRIDIQYYLENQILNCVTQILCLVVHLPLYEALKMIVNRYVHRWTNQINGRREITSFFTPKK